MRDEVLMQLVDKAAEDEHFRARAREDLDGALAEAGIELTDEEREAVRGFQQQAMDMSDDELKDQLVKRHAG